MLVHAVVRQITVKVSQSVIVVEVIALMASLAVALSREDLSSNVFSELQSLLKDFKGMYPMTKRN